MPHIVTTAPTIIPNNDTKIDGMPMPRPRPRRMASLSPPGVPVVSLAVAAEDRNIIDAYIRHSVLFFFRPSNYIISQNARQRIHIMKCSSSVWHTGGFVKVMSISVYMYKRKGCFDLIWFPLTCLHCCLRCSVVQFNMFSSLLVNR